MCLFQQAGCLKMPTASKLLKISISLLPYDGAKLYIPAVGEHVMTSGSALDSSTGIIQGNGTKTVNINQASESDRDALPGVGPVTAQKIIDKRPYQSVQELLDKKVVGQSVFLKIKDQVSVYLFSICNQITISQ